MQTQKELNELVQKYLAGQATASEKKLLQDTSKTNHELKDILELHSQLKDPELTFNTPGDKAFKKMRETTLNKIFQHKDNKFSLKLISLLDYLALPFRMPLVSSAFSIAMLILGIIIGNFYTNDDLISAINLAAQQSTNLQSSIDAPYFYSNAHFNELENGKLEVSFDVSRHIRIESQKNDPLVQDILAHSLINSNSMPSRLRYISKSTEIMHPKIKEALISTILNDSHPIVRQKSLFSLLQYPSDATIEEALFSVLRNEKSIYMRLAALDYLSHTPISEKLLNSEFNNLNYLKNSTVNQKPRQLNYNN